MYNAVHSTSHGVFHLWLFHPLLVCHVAKDFPEGCVLNGRMTRWSNLAKVILCYVPSCDSIRFRQFCESGQSTVIVAGATKKAKTKSQKESTSDGFKKSGPNPDITVSTKSVSVTSDVHCRHIVVDKMLSFINC